MEIRYKVMDNQFDFRLNMVRYSQEFSVCEAARVFGRTRKTVRKWRNRFTKEGLSGLTDHSRRPHYSPNKTSQRDRDKIIRLKKRLSHIGAERFHNEFGVKQSARTIQKICREEGLGRKKKSKRTKQRDLRAWKEANFKPLRYWVVDTKDCIDVPYYVERIYNGGFPRYLYQARDVRTNVLFSAYAFEQSNVNSALFIERLFDHLRSLGIPLNEVSVQTDNGSEFPRNGLDLTQPSAFEKAIMDVKANYIRIPPGAKNHQSDVERANGLIEYELLEIERWKTKSELVGLTTAWMYYFNRLRPNSYQQNRTPYQRMKHAGIQSQTAENVCLWTVTILDDPKLKRINFNLPWLPARRRRGYHVCKFDDFSWGKH
ncbi:MAG: helix-turn-helix domain-containing protein [Candidatus Marinimicrobia bacterium]|nr:helix-turn-helix domain-containing protein [Candidatus Neomarinimicrobiota bacterium]